MCEFCFRFFFHSLMIFLKLLFCCFIYFFHRLILGVFLLRLFCKYEHFYFCLFINTRKKRFQIRVLYRRTQEFGSSWFCCCFPEHWDFEQQTANVWSWSMNIYIRTNWTNERPTTTSFMSLRWASLTHCLHDVRYWSV